MQINLDFETIRHLNDKDKRELVQVIDELGLCIHRTMEATDINALYERFNAAVKSANEIIEMRPPKKA